MGGVGDDSDLSATMPKTEKAWCWLRGEDFFLPHLVEANSQQTKGEVENHWSPGCGGICRRQKWVSTCDEVLAAPSLWEGRSRCVFASPTKTGLG